MTSPFSKSASSDKRQSYDTDIDQHATDDFLFCPNCDYNLSGLSSHRCPTCGLELNHETFLASTTGSTANRTWIAITSLVIATATIVSTWALVSRGQRLSLFDAIVVLAVAMAVAGHITLAFQAARPRKSWPWRWDETATILTFLAGASILAGMAGATQVMSYEPSTLYNSEGIKVNGFFEFALLAGLIAMPGASLLIMTIISYRARASNRSASQQPTSDKTQATRSQHAPLKIIVRTHLAETNLSQSWNPTPRPTNASIERLISQTWEAELALAQTQDRMLYDGQLARLQRYETGPDATSLHLVLGPTCYRDFLCTNLYNSHLAHTFSHDHLSNALGVSILPLTVDGYIALGVRSNRVAYHAGRVHPFGGMVEALDRRSNGTFDLFGSAKRELIEELGINASQIQSLTLLGLIEDTQIKQPELVFVASLTLSRADLEIRLAAESGKDEHEAFHLSKATQDAAAALLSSDLPLTPVAIGTLLLYGQHRWGQAWFDKCSTAESFIV